MVMLLSGVHGMDRRGHGLSDDVVCKEVRWLGTLHRKVRRRLWNGARNRWSGLRKQTVDGNGHGEELRNDRQICVPIRSGEVVV